MKRPLTTAAANPLEESLQFRVLIATDNAAVRGRVRAALEAMDDDVISVSEADDGTAAVRRAEADQPDVILLDAATPTLSDVEPASAVVALPTIVRRAPRSTVLVLTDPAMAAAGRLALRLGADGCLAKENIEEIVAVVRAVILRHRVVGQRSQFGQRRPALTVGIVGRAGASVPTTHPNHPTILNSTSRME